jgi:SNF2 family DNA or RNA helicase
VNLYQHQAEGVEWLAKQPSAMLCDEMGCGKSRQVLVAAQKLFAERKIDRVIVLAPAAVRLSWRQEIAKLEQDSLVFMPCVYDPNKQIMYGAKSHLASTILPVAVLSYSLLPQKRHLDALTKWCRDGKALLVCDESVFLKNRTAKQTKGARALGEVSSYRWLLTGTPIANSPLDLYGQALVMANGDGPLKSFKSWWQFRARYGVLQSMNIGRRVFQQIVGYQNLPELTKRFAPYVLRRTKAECLDLPPKSYVVREVALSEKTWRIYQELKRDAMLALPDSEERPEPNAAVRLLRLAQITSGHVGVTPEYADITGNEEFREVHAVNDISSEKIDWLVEQILIGELANEKALIVWCRWRRERERLAKTLRSDLHNAWNVFEIYGGQTAQQRDLGIAAFQDEQKLCKSRRILLAQPHAGGFGLTLTAASTAVYLSNDFSYTTRVQSEDRQHRIGQTNPCTYIDVLAVGPKGQKTVDAHVLECLKAKKSVADLTCSAWRKILT